MEMKGVHGRLFRGRWGSKGRPRTAQERPKTAQDRSKIAPRTTKKGQEHPKSDPRATKTTPRAAKIDFTSFPRAEMPPRPSNINLSEQGAGRAKQALDKRGLTPTLPCTTY